MSTRDDYITVPPHEEVPHMLLSTSRHFSKHRVTKFSDAKAGWYIRVFFQPLYGNGRMLSMSIYQMYGRPYVQRTARTDGERGYTGESPQMKVREITYNRYEEPYHCERDRTFLSDAGINNRINGARLYRFTSKLWRELRDIQRMDDFAAWCWFTGNVPSEDQYLEFYLHVESEREEDRMWSRIESDYDYTDDDYGDTPEASEDPNTTAETPQGTGEWVKTEDRLPEEKDGEFSFGNVLAQRADNGVNFEVVSIAFLRRVSPAYVMWQKILPPTPVVNEQPETTSEEN